MRNRLPWKWLALGVIYVALLVGAFIQAHWAYADLLWTVTFFAVVYAGATALLARGPRQRFAGGFAIAASMLAIVMQLAPEHMPTGQLVAAAFPPPATPAPAL